MGNVNYIGIWTVKSENIKTGIIKEYSFKNAIVQGFFTLVHRFFSEDQLTVLNDDMNLTHLGIGDNITSVQRSDAALYNEEDRVTLTVKSFTDAEYTLQILLDTTQGNMPGGYIKELGIFAKGTATPDSGTLISRSVVDIQKNTNIRLTLTWEMRGTN